MGEVWKQINLDYPRGWVEIDLSKMKSNIINMKKNISSDTLMMLIIKANGYGHGAIQIAEMFEDISYIWGFGVATLEEAVELRNTGVKKPILVLGCIFPNQYQDAIVQGVRFNIYNQEMAYEVSRCAKELGQDALCHLKMDTGMSRLGFLCNEKSLEEILEIAKLPNLIFEGTFTHFAKADEKNKDAIERQTKIYNEYIEVLEKNGMDFAYKHCSNSAAIIDHPECNKDVVRAGISLYGLYPSDEVDVANVSLQPVLSWYSSITSIKEIKAGTQVSYGGTFAAETDMRIAVVPVGYADGYPRGLSNKGHVLIEGKKAPILGRVCMDQFMVDVTHIPEAKFMTLVTLVGQSGEEEISVEYLGDISGKFNYEFVCGIANRMPRVYG